MIVLNYHEIVERDVCSRWCLTRSQFEAHVGLFAGNIISPEAFLARRHDDRHAASGEVLLTFDDGFLSDYDYVYRHHTCELGRRFMSFIPVEHVGKPGRMTWQMIDELSRSNIPIGSHGLAHVDLTVQSDEALKRELQVSKSTLEDRLGRPVTLFAFPYGKFSERVWQAALDAGYECLFTIQLGYHNGFEDFLVSRLCVTNVMGPAYMKGHMADPCQDRGYGYRISSRLGLYRALMRWRYK